MLDRADLDRYGLIGNATSTATPPATSAAEKANATLEQQAITFVARSIRDWSLPTQEALARTGQYYASEVDLYGSALSRKRVLKDKQTLAARWPVRDNALDVTTATAACNLTACTVTGEVVWSARSPKRSATSSGRSSVDLTLAVRQNGLAFVREDGRVVHRD